MQQAPPAIQQCWDQQERETDGKRSKGRADAQLEQAGDCQPRQPEMPRQHVARYCPSAARRTALGINDFQAPRLQRKRLAGARPADDKVGTDDHEQCDLQQSALSRLVADTTTAGG